MEEIYAAYFGNSSTVTAALIPLLSLVGLYVVFRSCKSPRIRSCSLALMLFSSIFFWLLIAISLVLCYAFAGSYDLGMETTIRIVLGGALAGSVACALPLAILLRVFSPQILLSKVSVDAKPREDVSKIFRCLANEMGVRSAELRISKNAIPISFAVQAKRPVVVMSKTILSLLTEEELEAVMAHELAHIKNSDLTLKALVAACKTALPHDPVIRLVEAAFHRERELAADETAAKFLSSPLSLAKALLTIYDAFPSKSLRSYGALSILGSGSSAVRRQPSLRLRIDRLIRLAEEDDDKPRG